MRVDHRDLSECWYGPASWLLTDMRPCGWTQTLRLCAFATAQEEAQQAARDAKQAASRAAALAASTAGPSAAELKVADSTASAA